MTRCTIVATGAPLSRRLADLVAGIQAAGFEVDLLATASATAWVDLAEVTKSTGSTERVSSSYGPRLPLPDALVVCPATFNTLNKAALGLADTHAHSFICECIGAEIPTIIVPMINDRLWNHPVLAEHVDALEGAGVTFISVLNGEPGARPVPSGTGDQVVIDFDPAWITAQLPSAR
jgi:phosphopantothenoylcysteine synthetase/decarboxylase